MASVKNVGNSPVKQYFRFYVNPVLLCILIYMSRKQTHVFPMLHALILLLGIDGCEWSSVAANHSWKKLPNRTCSLDRLNTLSLILFYFLWTLDWNKLGWMELSIFAVVQAVCGQPLGGRGSTPQLLSVSPISVFRPTKFHPLSWNILINHCASHLSVIQNHLMKCLSLTVNPILTA